jgi:hypothetical protein
MALAAGCERDLAESEGALGDDRLQPRAGGGEFGE